MDILKGLNKEQKEAAKHGDGPLLIVAGAGTGKTTVITRRLAWLIESGLAKSNEILALTFTDKAAGEMEERIDKLLPYGYTNLWVSTFHGFGERILKNHALDIGVPYDFKLLSETEQWLLVRQHLEKFKLNYYRPLGNPTKFIHALVCHFSRAKDEEIYPEDYLQYAENKRLDFDKEKLSKAKKKKKVDEESGNEAARLEEVASAYHVYQQLMLEENALDFGDLINYTLKLFRTRPDVLDQYRHRFKYLLVDEFQDTNWAQYELVKLLAAPSNNLTVVGDDDQSIYRFRGAAMSNILQFQKDFPRAQSVVLVKNYRSTQNILDLSHAFIKQNDPNRLEYQLKVGKNGQALSKVLKAVTADSALIEHIAGRTRDDEQQLVMNKIRELLERNKDLNWGDFAILTRSNDQANQFDQALSRAGIPHRSYASKGLYRKPIIVDALAYLRMLDNYHESPSLWRVLNFPVWSFEGRDLVELSHWASRKSISLYEAMEDVHRNPNIAHGARQTIASILDWIATHTSFAREHKPTELLVKILNDISYTRYIESLGEAQAMMEFNYLNQFYNRVKRWEETQSSPRLKGFMDTMTYEIESGEEGDIDVSVDEGPDVTRVMTVHAAKGLEFTYVFIVGLVSLRFPTIERRDPIELPESLVKDILPEGDIHLEEERRLFYVAMTRAKRGLFFTSAEDYGGVRKKKPSIFLEELNLQLTEPCSLSTSLVFKESYGRGVENVPAALGEYIPEHFSFTQLKAFETCPFQYRYAHVLRVPVWGRHALSFGQSMHLTLERFFKLLLERKNTKQKNLFCEEKIKTKTPSWEEMLAIYNESWIDDWYTSKSIREEYFTRGKTALKNFYEKHKNEWPVTKEVEAGFTLRVGPYSIRGKVDRLDEIDGGIEIIDYKTGRVPKSERDIDKDQLLIYQMAAKEVWGANPKRLTFYYLNENKPISFLGTEEELEIMRQKIQGTIQEIKKGKFLATPSPRKCKYCDYKNICPFSEA